MGEAWQCGHIRIISTSSTYGNARPMLWKRRCRDQNNGFLKSNTRSPSGAPSVLPTTTQPFIRTRNSILPLLAMSSTSCPVALHATVPYGNTRHSQRDDHSAAENLTLFVCHLLPAPYLAHASLAYPPILASNTQRI